MISMRRLVGRFARMATTTLLATIVLNSACLESNPTDSQAQYDLLLKVELDRHTTKTDFLVDQVKSWRDVLVGNTNYACGSAYGKRSIGVEPDTSTTWTWPNTTYADGFVYNNHTYQIDRDAWSLLRTDASAQARPFYIIAVERLGPARGLFDPCNIDITLGYTYRTPIINNVCVFSRREPITFIFQDEVRDLVRDWNSYIITHSWGGAGINESDVLRQVVEHEFGHALGLAHYTYSQGFDVCDDGTGNHEADPWNATCECVMNTGATAGLYTLCKATTTDQAVKAAGFVLGGQCLCPAHRNYLAATRSSACPYDTLKAGGWHYRYPD